MPNPSLAAGIVVMTVVTAAAIAVYESPQARQFADDVRRKIALALHTLGSEINPQSQQPRFNRPEDAEGFMQSSTVPGVDADEESKRRQREELMYWNAVRLEKQAKEAKLREESSTQNRSRGQGFDDFSHEDHTAEKGTWIYRSGADTSNGADQGLRQRGVQGLDRSLAYANPFADEHNIDVEEQRAVDASLMSPQTDEASEELYCASPLPTQSCMTSATLEEQLVDTSEAVPDPPVSYPSQDELRLNSTASDLSPRDEAAFASMYAWGQSSETTSNFYSPLPTTPRAGTPQQTAGLSRAESPTQFSDPPESVPGDLTPTDSMSIADSAEHISMPHSVAASEADVVSDDEDGCPTPESWSEVGSDISENDDVSGRYR